MLGSELFESSQKDADELPIFLREDVDTTSTTKSPSKHTGNAAPMEGTDATETSRVKQDAAVSEALVAADVVREVTSKEQTDLLHSRSAASPPAAAEASFQQDALTPPASAEANAITAAGFTSAMETTTAAEGDEPDGDVHVEAPDSNGNVNPVARVPPSLSATPPVAQTVSAEDVSDGGLHSAPFLSPSPVLAETVTGLEQPDGGFAAAPTIASEHPSTPVAGTPEREGPAPASAGAAHAHSASTRAEDSVLHAGTPIGAVASDAKTPSPTTEAPPSQSSGNALPDFDDAPRTAQTYEDNSDLDDPVDHGQATDDGPAERPDSEHAKGASDEHPEESATSHPPPAVDAPPAALARATPVGEDHVPLSTLHPVPPSRENRLHPSVPSSRGPRDGRPSSGLRSLSSTRVKSSAKHAAPKNFTTGSSTTFFFDKERHKNIGVGTVGLYASRAVPVFAETFSTRGPQAPPPHGVADEDALGRTYYTSTFYSVPTHGAIAAWDAKERSYVEWRDSRLARSLYRTYEGSYTARRRPHGSGEGSGDTGVAAGSSEEGGRGCHRDGPRRDRRLFPMRGADGLGNTAQAEFGADGLPRDSETFERDRLRAMAAARRAKAEARSQRIEAQSNELLERRHRSRYGEAVDLPPAYYERVWAVFPDKKTPDDITPKDHAAACAFEKAQRAQQREFEEERRREEAQKMKEETAAQLKASRVASQEYQDELMEGLPRLTRVTAEARRTDREEHEREAAKLNKAERDANRNLYAQLERAEADAETQRQRGLQEKVGRVVAHRGGAGVRDGRALLSRPGSAKRGKVTRPPSAALERTDREGTAAAPATPAEEEGHEAVTAVPAVFQPTSTNFFAEVKSWQQCFQSPNVAPPSGADCAVRRDWLRQLDADRLQFKQETVTMEREERPQRIGAAREAQYQKVHQAAEDERTAKQALSTQAATTKQRWSMYAGKTHEAQRQQQGRVRAARAAKEEDRRQRADDLRERERKADAAAAEQEEAERAQLRSLVATARG